jgi:hypothetical protein
MSTGLSFVPARRRSREARARLNLLRTAPGLATAAWLRRHAGAGRLQASQALRAGREGRKLPVEGEGSSADGRGTGRVHDKRGAKRSGCVSAGMPQIDPTVSAHQETSQPRHRLTCGGCANLCDAGRPPGSWASAAVVAGAVPSRAESLVGSSCEEFQRAKLVGSPSESGQIVDRCTFYRGRDEDCSPPPAQIPACAANAPGSSLGFWRRSGDLAGGVAS